MDEFHRLPTLAIFKGDSLYICADLEAETNFFKVYYLKYLS